MSHPSCCRTAQQWSGQHLRPLSGGPPHLIASSAKNGPDKAIPSGGRRVYAAAFFNCADTVGGRNV